LVKIIPELSATRNAMFKVIRSNTEIAITAPQIAQLPSKKYRISLRNRRYAAKSQRKVIYC